MSSDREVVKAIKENLEHQNNDWRFAMGREILTKEEMIKRLDKDKKFRKDIVKLVLDLSIDILARQGS